ncbi:MAG: response regulator transcription factor [Flavobacteriales bacterium]|nr:response regulator transcription factor [Flavobacteriales bacterium]
MRKNVISFGLLIAALVILFQISQYQLIQGNIGIELIVVLVSIVFFFLGLYFRKKWQAKSGDEFLSANQINYGEQKKLGISDREQEVLQHLSDGLSNKEIADKLFITESTTKSHVSSLYQKLEVSRRPQAILKAQQSLLVINQ